MPIFDKDKSKIKLWVAVKGAEKGIVYYSILSQDHKSEKEIISKMTKRILDNKYQGIYITAQFYDNQTNRLIEIIKGQYYDVDKDHAKIKLWVGFPDIKDNDTWYNWQSERHLEYDIIIKEMTDRLLRDKYKFQFTKALFFQNQSGILIKEVEGALIKK